MRQTVKMTVTVAVLIAAAALTQGAGALASGVAAGARAGGRAVPAQPAACCSATSADSPKVGGNFGDQDYSSLAQIGAASVSRLSGAWAHHFVQARSDLAQESTPAEVDGVIYVQDWQGTVSALSATTGKLIWTYSVEYYKRPGPDRHRQRRHQEDARSPLRAARR